MVSDELVARLIMQALSGASKEGALNTEEESLADVVEGAIPSGVEDPRALAGKIVGVFRSLSSDSNGVYRLDDLGTFSIVKGVIMLHQTLCATQ